MQSEVHKTRFCIQKKNAILVFLRIKDLKCLRIKDLKYLRIKKYIYTCGVCIELLIKAHNHFFYGYDSYYQLYMCEDIL